MHSAAPSTVAQARRVATWLLIGSIGVLAVTGLYLAFFYRPSAAAAWNDIYALKREVSFALWVRRIHRWTAVAAIVVALGLAGLMVAEGLGTRSSGAQRRRSWIAIGPAIVVLVVAGSSTGYLLPWDQLALWSVTVGSNLDGYRALFDDRVRFVLVGGAEVSPGTMRAWLLVHTIAIPAVLGGLGLLARRRHEDVDPSPPAPARTATAD